MERDGQSMTIVQTFERKAEGGMEPPPGEIKDGTIDGNRFSINTRMPTPNGD